MTGPVGESDDTEQLEPDNGGWGTQAMPGEPRDEGQVEPDNGGWSSQ